MALIQTTPPDKDGNMNLGVSVDIVRAAVEKAGIVIAQPNSYMPVVEGDGWISMDDVDYIIAKDEPLLEYIEDVPGDIAQKIGRYVSRIVEDGSTIQVGYGSIPNAIVSSLQGKKHLGVHTELLNDGIAGLMEKGVVDNSQKSINPGKSIATFCMGRRQTFDFLRENSSIEFRTIDYTNNPLIIAENRKMTAINSALEVDLTGQATAESLGHSFYSGIGGQADFMRGAALAPGGKTILALPSTAQSMRTGCISKRTACLQDCALPEGGGRSHINAGRYSLRCHRIRHRLLARQEHSREGYGPHLHCPSQVSGSG